jgi:hypothetical protein
MTVLALVLLLLCAAAPAVLPLLRRWVPDPVLPTAVLATLLLALAAGVAAGTDPAHGWRLAAALVLGVAAATTGGGLVVRGVFRLMRKEWRPWSGPSRSTSRADGVPSPVDDPAASDEGATESADDDFGPADAEPVETVLRGGAWIGFLERAAVAATLLAGWPEGMALVLAVKGVGRYSELRETNAPEAFIIGTLASLLWAGAAAGTAQLLR